MRLLAGSGVAALLILGASGTFGGPTVAGATPGPPPSPCTDGLQDESTTCLMPASGSITIEAAGGSGGSGAFDGAGSGGAGADVEDTVTVTGGDVLTITVGAGGEDAGANGSDTQAPGHGGSPGGAGGGDGTLGGAGQGGGAGGGGAYSSVYDGGTDLITAGGGGGGGGGGQGGDTPSGGHGGSAGGGSNGGSAPGAGGGSAGANGAESGTGGSGGGPSSLGGGGGGGGGGCDGGSGAGAANSLDNGGGGGGAGTSCGSASLTYLGATSRSKNPNFYVYDSGACDSICGAAGYVILSNIPTPPNPMATISSPGNDQTFTQNEVVPISFSCAEAADGIGLSDCYDDYGNGNDDFGSLGTLSFTEPGSTAYLNTSQTDAEYGGAQVYDVYADSYSGASAVATIYYAVTAPGAVGPPWASITAPSNNETFYEGESESTSFSCQAGSNGGTLSSCDDSTGESTASGGSGQLDTSTVGTNETYTVTATDADSQTDTYAINYNVVALPSASLGSPTGTPTYYQGESVATSFSCTEGTDGPGLSSCDDNNGKDTIGGGSGVIDTSTVGTGEHYTVTATSQDGGTSTKTLTYNVAVLPSASLGSPTGTPTYYQGESVATSFSCTEGTDGPGLSSCDDNNGKDTIGGGSGVIDTSTVGTGEHYTVTATSQDGGASTKTLTYNVAVLPTASLGSPTGTPTYYQGESVATSFSCTEGTDGPGLSSCDDNNGKDTIGGGSGVIDTSTVGTGEHYTVTATSQDGGASTKTLTYNVAALPTASLLVGGAAASDGVTYYQGESVATSFSCAEGVHGTGLTQCADSNGVAGTISGSGAASTGSGSGSLPTGTVGTNESYSVTVKSADGAAVTETVTYNVAALPTASLLVGGAAASDGVTYYQGESVATSFSCAEGVHGTGLTQCADSNGVAGTISGSGAASTGSGSGSLPTGTVGTNESYSVTVKSADGATVTETVTYNVAALPTASSLTTTSSAAFTLVAPPRYADGHIELTLLLPNGGTILLVGRHIALLTGKLPGRHGARIVVVGHGGASVTTSSQVSLKLTLNKRGKALLAYARAHHHALHVWVQITYKPNGGTPRTQWIEIRVLKGQAWV